MTRRVFPLLLRFILATVFLIAGGGKLSDSLAFAQAIAAFQILPSAMIPAAALALPFLEILIGGLLLTGWYRRGAALSAVILLGIYTLALVAALARNLPLECDCFGTATPLPWALARDIFLLSCAVAFYGREIRNSSRPAGT
jgi:uncharacterized membrane protein YphA (DoxX/SURF4 family)